MIPKKTIAELILKHTILEKELSSGTIDKKLFAEKSKEYSDINEIVDIAKKYLNEPAEILIKSVKKETQLIKQRYINVQRHHKLAALRRILEIMKLLIELLL